MENTNVPEQKTTAQPPGPVYDYTDFKNPTYNIVSVVAYLIGVEPQNFSPPGNRRLDLDIYEKLEKNKNARIIRNLCRIRTGLERNYSAIRNAFRYDIKNIGSIPDYVPADAVSQLSQDGVNIYRSKPDVDEYMKEESANRMERFIHSVRSA